MKITVLRLPRLLLFPVAGLLLAALALLLWQSGGPVSRSVLAPALLGRSVVIDPGHGGFDPGVSAGLGPEDEVNLAVARKLAEYCRSAGATVTLTRQDDEALADSKRPDMEARVAIARQAEADLFLSVHCNSYVGDRSQHGAQVFYQGGNEEGRLLAETLQACLATELGNTERTALRHPDSFLLRSIPGPAAIAEIGFLTNQEEEKLLHDEDYQWDVAWGLFLGVNEYFLAAEAQ